MLDRRNPYNASTDEHFMYEALLLAQGGLGWASPNPLVGCVLVRDGSLIGSGFHARDGEQHAEVNALNSAGDASGATAYVSLEPCSHVGRQPSCCHELASAGVRRVVWGAEDTDPRSAGRAHQVLSQLGVSTIGRALAADCERFLDYYSHARRRQQPFVHLKLALSLDGKVACPSGRSQWLSGPQSLGYAHYLRLKYDAVLIGYRTALADDPRLTVRSEELVKYDSSLYDHKLRQPVRVVVDPRGAVMARLKELKLAQLNEGQFREHLPRLVIITGDDCEPVDSTAEYTRIVRIPRSGSAPMQFAQITDALWQMGVQSLLVEGGGKLASELFAQRAVNKASLVFTPKILGSDGIGFTPEISCAEVAECPVLDQCRGTIMGDNVLLEGYPTWK